MTTYDLLSQRRDQLKRESEVLAGRRDEIELEIVKTNAALAEIERALDHLSSHGHTGSESSSEVPRPAEPPRSATTSIMAWSGSRPTIKELAKDLARQNGGTFRVRDLVPITQRWGYRSDHGGLHTSLVGMKEFAHVPRGMFRLLDESV